MLDKATSMDEVLSRFPHLADKIFQELENQSLVQCKLVTRSWKKFIMNEKKYYFRKIQFCTNYSHASLKNILRKKNLEFTIKFSSDVCKIFSDMDHEPVLHNAYFYRHHRVLG